MDFGIFNLLQHRDRSKPPHEVIAEALEHTQLAEELGFSRAWFAEHHFSNYSLCPSPLIFCNQVAATTKRIRVGCAVLILPLHAPARVIAEIALRSPAAALMWGSAAAISIMSLSDWAPTLVGTR